ncbi:MAG: hypothetical protein E6Q97_14670 [Desulfurellales bacterium]|nr:MAG: hypothetical protein E6Q97_14670 [Desulfurellales bacterium]
MQDGAIRVVVFQEGSAWIAQCLEYDVYARADSLDAVRERMLATLGAEVDYAKSKGVDPFAGIEAAPQHYQAMWEQRSSFVKPERLEGGDDGHVQLALDETRTPEGCCSAV